MNNTNNTEKGMKSQKKESNKFTLTVILLLFY